MGSWAPKVVAVFRQILVVLTCMQILEKTHFPVEAGCAFQAIFNFGDSNSDTGGFYAAFPGETRPFGMTYFKKPAGRASDGRLVIDFLAQSMGLPFLSPYLRSIRSNFKHGANYATMSSTVLLPNTSQFVTGVSPFSLQIQLNQMKNFKARVLEFHSKEKSSKSLPTPDVFGKSLYTFDIGQNDFTSNLASIGVGGVKQCLPQVVSQIAQTIKELYDEGGCTFLVLNLAPIGCFPAFLTDLPHDKSDLDSYGCMMSYNNAVSDYNNMLKEKLHEIQKLLPSASIIYVDTYSVKLDYYRNPTKHGFKYGTKACCGYGGGTYNFNTQVRCGNKKVINGTIAEATACSDPENYVSWDGIHSTEAANKALTWAILSGSYFDPPFPINKLCELHPIG